MNKTNVRLAACRPFEIAVPDETLADIRARVAAFPWHEMPDDGGWDYGSNLDYMKELCAYWLKSHDRMAFSSEHALFIECSTRKRRRKRAD